MGLILDLLSVVVAALMAGNELAIAAFVHPGLSQLDDQTHSRAAQVLARRLGRVMPFWYAATLVLAVLVTVTRPVGSTCQWLAGASSVLFAECILSTIFGLVPINNRVAAWDLSALPDGWLSDRRRWDRMHVVRVVKLVVAVALLISSIALRPA